MNYAFLTYCALLTTVLSSMFKARGSKPTKKCYLDPGASYIHASTIHEKERLRLKGLSDDRRFLKYHTAYSSSLFLSRGDLDPALEGEVVKRLEKALAKLENK